MRIGATQYNYAYGSQLHFPYSIGTVLAAMPEGFPAEVIHCGIEREYWQSDVPLLAKTDILLCSMYVWNIEITLKVIQGVKQLNPNIMVICGGPQIPDEAQVWLQEHPEVDYVVHGEGEGALWKALSLPPEEWRTVAGLEGPGWVGPPRERIMDLETIPSPYLNGTIDELTKFAHSNPDWIVTWETNRGCPFKCHYCDWGSNIFAKMRQFPMERLRQEVEWFAKKQIVYIDCGDSNFGIFPRDGDIAQMLLEAVQTYGWKTTFRQSWAKNSSTKILPIAKTLKAANVLTAVGLALESMDEVTLKTIERANIKFSSFTELTRMFREAGLPTYTELIRAMPGETVGSFRDGLAKLVENSDIKAIYIYNCSILPNAQMAAPRYRQEHGIRSVRSPIYLAHSQANRSDVSEYEDIVIETATASMADVEQMHLLSWMVIVFHSLGLLKYAMTQSGLPPMEFYEHVLNNPTPTLAAEIERVRQHVKRGFRGEGWDHVDPKYGPIVWPIEEASWLRLVDSDGAFNQELIKLFGYALAMRQINKWNMRVMDQDAFEWAKEVMWYGRRRGAYLRETI